MSASVALLARPVALVVLLGLIATGVGRLLLGSRRADGESLALALPLGLGVLGLAAFPLLALGLLRPWPMAAAGALAATAALPGLRRWGADFAALRASLPRPGRRVAALALALSAALLGALALYPPSAWDATIYHLPLSRAFVEAGGFVFAADLRVPVFPLFAESLFAVLTLAAGDLAAQQLQALAVLATALLAAAWAQARLSAMPAAGALAAAIYLGSPIVVLYAGTAYVDPLLALFATAALVALDRCRREGGERWALLAGGLAGAAAAVKYLGLFFAVVVPLALALSAPGARPGRGRLRLAAIAALAATLTLAPWYLRLLALTGNPVFPFAPTIFGASEWSLRATQATETVDASGTLLLPDGADAVPRRLSALPRLPFDLLLARERYNHQPPFSPAVLLLWPALALAAWRHPWTRPLATVGLGYVLCLTPLPADSRYLLPILPLAAVLIAAAAEAALDLAGAPLPRTRGLLTATALALWLGLPLYAGFHFRRLGPLPTTAGGRADHLARRIPGYRGVEAANAWGGGGRSVYLLRAERLHYFVAGRGLGDFNGPARFELVEPLLDEPLALGAKLAELGAELLLAPRPIADRLERNEGFRHRFRTIYRDGEVVVFAPQPAPGTSRGAAPESRGGAPASSDPDPSTTAGRVAERPARVNP